MKFIFSLVFLFSLSSLLSFPIYSMEIQKNDDAIFKQTPGDPLIRLARLLIKIKHNVDSSVFYDTAALKEYLNKPDVVINKKEINKTIYQFFYDCMESHVLIALKYTDVDLLLTYIKNNRDYELIKFIKETEKASLILRWIEAANYNDASLKLNTIISAQNPRFYVNLSGLIANPREDRKLYFDKLIKFIDFKGIDQNYYDAVIRPAMEEINDTSKYAIDRAMRKSKAEYVADLRDQTFYIPFKIKKLLINESLKARIVAAHGYIFQPVLKRTTTGLMFYVSMYNPYKSGHKVNGRFKILASIRDLTGQFQLLQEREKHFAHPSLPLFMAINLSQTNGADVVQSSDEITMAFEITPIASKEIFFSREEKILLLKEIFPVALPNDIEQKLFSLNFSNHAFSRSLDFLRLHASEQTIFYAFIKAIKKDAKNILNNNEIKKVQWEKLHSLLPHINVDNLSVAYIKNVVISDILAVSADIKRIPDGPEGATEFFYNGQTLPSLQGWAWYSELRDLANDREGKEGDNNQAESQVRIVFNKQALPLKANKEIELTANCFEFCGYTVFPSIFVEQKTKVVKQFKKAGRGGKKMRSKETMVDNLIKKIRISLENPLLDMAFTTDLQAHVSITIDNRTTKFNDVVFKAGEHFHDILLPANTKLPDDKFEFVITLQMLGYQGPQPNLNI